MTSKIYAASVALFAAAALMPAAAQAQDAAVPAAAAPAVADVAALDPARLALAREIVGIAYPPETRAQTFSTLTDVVMQQVMQMRTKPMSDDPELNALFDRELDGLITKVKAVFTAHIPEIMDGMAQSYASEFTVEELAGIRDFAKTPTGQSYFSKAVKIASNPYYVAALQPYVKDIKASQEAWAADLGKTLADYVAKKTSKKPVKASHAS